MIHLAAELPYTCADKAQQDLSPILYTGRTAAMLWKRWLQGGDLLAHAVHLQEQQAGRPGSGSKWDTTAI